MHRYQVPESRERHARLSCKSDVTYRSNGAVERTCAVCEEPIVEDDWMMDLFRDRILTGSAVVEWVHERCARRALETWIERKRARAAAPAPESKGCDGCES